MKKETTSTTITPTKSNPVFIAENDYFGYIDPSMYKDGFCGNCSFKIFAIYYASAINNIHQFIQLNDHLIQNFPKSKYNIYMIDGSLDKNGDTIYKKVYTISSAKAKKYLKFKN
tara:strand:- start:22797 stop:23138 length:342 start_codon:yes stop_codon:yes gene_type:complete